MEELFNKLNAKFIAYNWHKSSRRSTNEITEKLKSEIIKLLSIPVEKRVSPTEPTFTLSEVEDACNIFHNKALIDRLIMGDKIDYKKHFNGVIEIVKERRWAKFGANDVADKTPMEIN